MKNFIEYISHVFTHKWIYDGIVSPHIPFFYIDAINAVELKLKKNKQKEISK